MDNQFHVWRACALKAASAAITRECLSVLRDKQVSAEDKLLALKAMLQEQSRLEFEYLKAMEKV